MITDDFYLNEKPLKIISGAIHYFRVVPEYWRDRLEKLKAMGCNTVETYVPWNMHEPNEGEFCFEGIYDLRKFIQLAAELGLYVILRPSPYICAEWEFGGLPYWLLKNERIKLRFNDDVYMAKVRNYFTRLMKEVVDLQVNFSGPIILMQVENEYGGYANDSTYLNVLADLMIELGVVVPLVTSDGPWKDMLENGSIQDKALATINCGSRIKEQFKRLKTFHGEKKPLMVMEFWIGWFDAWGDEAHHTTDVESAASELHDILEEGSVNIYMFHGGTNFGFHNGSNYYSKLAPDTTTYDYDALLTEWGDITPKYKAFKKIISKHTEIPNVEFSTQIEKMNYGTIHCQDKVALFSNLKNLSQATMSIAPLSMEDLNQGFGYVYYTSNIGKNRNIEDFKFVNVKDRAHVFINEELKFIKYDLDMEEVEKFALTAPTNELGILVENMGRVNYSVKMNHQRKGIVDGVVINGAFHSQWTQYSLPMNNLEKLDYTLDWKEFVPAFYRFIFEVKKIGDTFIDMKGWGKGIVLINGFNIGRFWEIGPQERLYIPGPLLKIGMNEIIVFETDGKSKDTITLTDEPKL